MFQWAFCTIQARVMNSELPELSDDNRRVTVSLEGWIKGAGKKQQPFGPPAVNLDKLMFNHIEFRVVSKHKLELYFIITILQKE